MKETAMCGRRQFSVGVAAAALGGFTVARAQSDSPIVLGQSAALSGPAGQLGIQFRQGAQLYFDQYNAQGGGRPIVLRSLDDGYDPERCEANTRSFIDDDVLALFGYIGTPTSLAALPLITRNRIPFIAPFTGADALRQPFNRLVFHVRASYSDETALITRQLTHLGLERIAVFHQNDSYGQAGLDGMVKALAEHKLAPSARATVERNSVDVAAAVKTIVAAGPQAVIQVCTYAASAAFIRAARKAGYGGKFYNLSFVGTQALANELGKEAEGIVVSQVMPSPYLKSRQLSREFQDAIRKGANKVQPNYSSLEGYLAARVCAEGLRRAGDKPSREGLITGLEAIGSQVAGFSLAFSAGSHAGSHFVEMSMLTGDGRVRV